MYENLFAKGVRYLTWNKPDDRFAPVALYADRHAPQAEGNHPAPCARHCEANAFRIEIRNLKSQVVRLEAQRDELLQDAKRYRWLREQHWSKDGLCVTYAHAVKLGYDCPSGERLDEAIDDAIARVKPPDEDVEE